MARVAFPARCAVAVIHDDHLLSQVYPAAVPIETYIDHVVELIDDDLRKRGASGLDSTVTYELHRSNGTRLDISRTLDELGIEDGTTLMLVPADDGEPFEPQYESLSTGLARISKRLFTPVDTETAAATAVGIVGLAVATVLGLAVASRLAADSLAPAVVAGVVGALPAIGALWVWRWWPDRSDLLDPLSWLAIPLLALGLAAAAPGRPGAAHVFIAALAAGVFTGALGILTRRHLTAVAATVTLCAVGGLVATARMWAPIPAQRLGICVLIALLILLGLAPTAALWAARLRPPHFGSITGRDLFSRNEGLPSDAVAPVPEEPDTTPDAALITASARRANAVLTGICAGAAISLSPAVWVTLTPEEPHSAAAALLSLLIVIVFISRARSFTDRRQAVTLVVGAAAAFFVGVARLVTAATTTSVMPLLLGTVVLVVFAGATLAAGLLVPVTRFTPLVRMLVEWLELLAITAALPLAAWIGGLFAWIRMR